MNFLLLFTGIRVGRYAAQLARSLVLSNLSYELSHPIHTSCTNLSQHFVETPDPIEQALDSCIQHITWPIIVKFYQQHFFRFLCPLCFPINCGPE